MIRSSTPIRPLCVLTLLAVAGCSGSEGERRAQGAVFGASAGALAGSLVASDGDKGDAARLGALIGALVGSQIAAGAAHEMNNPLTVISGRAQLLASRPGRNG